MTVPASIEHAAVDAGAHADADAAAGMLQQGLPTHEYAKADPADMARTKTATVTMATKRFMPLQTWCPDDHTTSAVPSSARNRSYLASIGCTGHVS